MRHLQNAALAVALLFFVRSAPAQTPAPIAEHQGLQATSDCSRCHANKTTGKSVHTAMELGCARCHQVVTEGKSTNIRLAMPKVQLCLACHLKSSDEILHDPYVKGRCTSCHDAHSSDYPVHLRAESNGLCLQCHASQRAQANSAASMPEQPLTDGTPPSVVSATTFESALQAIHGSAESFLTMIFALQDRHQPVLCLSCHAPHSSQQGKLLRATGPRF